MGTGSIYRESYGYHPHRPVVELNDSPDRAMRVVAVWLYIDETLVHPHRPYAGIDPKPSAGFAGGLFLPVGIIN
jgi:hypothetical protein